MKRLTLLSRFYLCLLLFVLPFKFGVVLTNSEIAFFPLSPLEWCLTQWPPFLLPVLIAPALIMSSFCGCRKAWSGTQIFLVAIIGLLLAASLIGLIKTTEMDYAQLFVWQVAGLLALVGAAILQVNADARFRKWAFWCIIAGTLAAAWSGWSQAVGGEYKATIEYVKQLEAKGAGNLSDEIVARLERGRVSGPFVYPNSFAAHLILTLPLVVVAFWQLGKNISPAMVSSPLLAGACTVFVGVPLVCTLSRAAIVALIAATILLVFLGTVRDRKKFPKAVLTAGVAAILGISILLAVNKGRDFGSLGARVDYVQTGLHMFQAEPVTGVGLGEYFPWYIRLKPAEAEDVRVPHNVAILFLSQCGIFGGLAVALWGIGTLAVFFNGRICRTGHDPVGWAIALGGTAWLIHALVDFNFQISGTVATVGVLAALAGEQRPEDGAAADDASPPKCPWALPVQSGALVLAVVCFAGLWRWPGEKVYQQFYQQAIYNGADWETCRPLGEKAHQLNPLSPYPAMIMARMHLDEQRFPEAIAYLEQALARVPHRGSLWYLLARVKARTGDREGAGEAYLKARVWVSELRAGQLPNDAKPAIPSKP